ncbi:MAG: glutaredoxin family protein [Candidatus Roizmanbacteria bacterium]|nr:glutaredoxin family protein [Candidatus Roizmanbacteria bacterium]
MKITVYTIADCQFSKQEKEYLISHSLQYEEKNLETNKDFLTEMLAVSNNFAGTPVTRVEKDDGTITVLKGFTEKEFDTTFGFKEEAAPPPKVEETKPVEPAVAEVKPAKEPAKPVEIPPQPSNSEPTNQVTSNDSQLGAVLDKLEEKTASETPPPTTSSTPPITPPVIPEPDFK